MARAIQPHIITDDSAYSGKTIGGSLLLSRGFNDSLGRTPTSTGNRKVWTFSIWFKLSSTHYISGVNHIWSSYGNNDGIAAIYMNAGKIDTYFDTSGSNPYGNVNSRFYRDLTQWYHLVWRVDATNTTQKIWINGDEESISSSLNPPNFSYSMNQSGQLNSIGAAAWSTSNSADMYITEVHHVDGTLYDANHFGFYESSTGNWVPKSSEIIKANTTYGTNGFYLPLDGTDHIGTDKSGNNNHFKPNKPSLNAVYDLSKATGGLPILDTNTGGTNLANFFQTRQDPFAANCVLAIPMVNGPRYQVRDFSADVRGSGSNKTLTVNGTDVSDRNIAFAGPSRYFDGNDDYISIPDSSDFTFDGDFCIEMWIRPTSVSGTRRLISSESGNPAFIFRLDGNKFSAYLKASGGQQSYMTSSNFTLNTDQWYHLAMTRESGSFRTFVNGILDQTSTYTHTVDVSSTVEIGRYVSGSEYYVGYMQDVRVYKGVAKYTNSFIPPKPLGGNSTGSDGGWVTPDTPCGTAVGRLPDNGRLTSGSVCFDGLGDSTASQSALSIADSNDFYFDADFTIECYFYRGYNPINVGGLLGQWVSGGGNDRNVQIYVNSNGTLSGYMNRGGTNYQVGDTDEVKGGYWNHIAMVLQGSTLRLYINGKQNASTTVSGSPNNATKPFFIGSEGNSSSQSAYSYSGHITNVRVVKGVAVYPDGTEFTPSTTPLTNITGTVLLCCQSRTSATEAAVTPSAIQTHGTSNSKVAACNFNPFDKLDTLGQESNYCILNGIDASNNTGTGEGGLFWNCSTGPGIARGTLSFNSGKYYYEAAMILANRMHMGAIRTRGDIGADDIWHDTDMGNSGNEWAYRTDGYSVHNSGETQISPKSLMYTSEVLMCAIDADDDKIYFGRDGIWLNGANPELGLNPHYSNLSGTLAPALGRRSGSNSARANFGQKPFKFPPPVGYKPLCTSNIQSQGINPKKHFDVVTYNGNGPTGQSITGLDFKPDLVWIKSRSFSNNHHMFDIVRGPDKILRTSTSDAESEVTGVMSSFNSNGFTVKEGGGNNATNANGQQLVAWCWKAGGAASSNSNGTITTSVSVNQEAGFSIVTWTGDGNVNSTVGHGLNGRPDFIMLKARTHGANWRIYHRYYGNNATSGLYHADGGSTTHDSWGGIKAVGTTNFGFGTNGTNDLYGVNRSGVTYVAYCWKSVEGHSAFGTYIGNGQSSGLGGPFVNLGFRPSLIIRKKISDTGDWLMMDTARHEDNVVDNRIKIEGSTEQGSGNNIDILSNGFKERSSDGYSNANNSIMIYMAWGDRPAHTPFGIQNEAR